MGVCYAVNQENETRCPRHHFFVHADNRFRPSRRRCNRDAERRREQLSECVYEFRVGLLLFTDGHAPAPVWPGRAVSRRRGANDIAGVNPDISRYTDFQKLSAIGHAGTFLSGNVQVNGGNLPWAPIQITVTCNGKASFTTTTDSKGDFVIADKERFDTVQAFGRQKSFVGQFIGCTVTAALPASNPPN